MKTEKCKVNCVHTFNNDVPHSVCEEQERIAAAAVLMVAVKFKTQIEDYRYYHADQVY